MVTSGRGCILMLLVLVLTVWICAHVSSSLDRDFEGDPDAIIVLAGGVDRSGEPHETVMRRLQQAESHYREQTARTGKSPAVICNGGGTTHKPKWVDAAGYAVPEAALMGRKLIGMGVSRSDVYVEGYSDDTIGNAFFVRVMHMDLRPMWRRILIITSRFQLARTEAL